MPYIVAIGMAREFGPVLVGVVMVAARVACSIAAEIGTMEVTGQVDALMTLSTNPIKYLAVPRVLAAALDRASFWWRLVIPSASWAAGSSAWSWLDFNAAVYLANNIEFLQAADIASGVSQGCGVRLHRGADGLLLRHDRRPRRTGRGQGRRSPGGRWLRFGAYSRLELHADSLYSFPDDRASRHYP